MGGVREREEGFYAIYIGLRRHAFKFDYYWRTFKTRQTDMPISSKINYLLLCFYRFTLIAVLWWQINWFRACAKKIIETIGTEIVWSGSLSTSSNFPEFFISFPDLFNHINSQKEAIKEALVIGSRSQVSVRNPLSTCEKIMSTNKKIQNLSIWYWKGAARNTKDLDNCIIYFEWAGTISSLVMTWPDDYGTTPFRLSIISIPKKLNYSKQIIIILRCMVNEKY